MKIIVICATFTILVIYTIAIPCGTFNCGGTDKCCSQNQIGPSSVCFNPDTHFCTANLDKGAQQSSCLCARNNRDCCCRGICYDSTKYYCAPNQFPEIIGQKATSTAPATLTVSVQETFEAFVNGAPICSDPPGAPGFEQSRICNIPALARGDVVCVIGHNANPATAQISAQITYKGKTFNTNNSWRCRAGAASNPLVCFLAASPPWFDAQQVPNGASSVGNPANPWASGLSNDFPNKNGVNGPLKHIWLGTNADVTCCFVIPSNA
jgi:hypothetical protein